MTSLLFDLCRTAHTGPQYAYLGPGLGTGTIGAVLGIIGSIFLGLFAIIYYPIKRMVKMIGRLFKKNKKQSIPPSPKDIN